MSFLKSAAGFNPTLIQKYIDRILTALYISQQRLSATNEEIFRVKEWSLDYISDDVHYAMVDLKTTSNISS